MPFQAPQQWPLSSHLPATYPPLAGRDKSRSNGSTCASKQMGDQVCLSVHTIHESGWIPRPCDLPLVGGQGEVLQGMGIHTVLGQPPPIHRLLSSLKLMFPSAAWPFLDVDSSERLLVSLSGSVTLNGGVGDSFKGQFRFIPLSTSGIHHTLNWFHG